jgi:predicted ATPase/DNA-binding winged helix-turn-helix (wHTH) protein
MRLQFEGFELDTERRTLSVSGRELEVEPRVFDVLAYLLEHCDRVVPKEELLDELWGDRFVSQSALSTAVKNVRRALGDSGTEQRIVRTVHGRGFRVVVPVERTAPPPTDEQDTPAPPTCRPAGGLRRLPRSVALVGRDADLERLRSLIEPCVMVTIAGPGGVGKTSLALAMARELAADNDHEVWFCELTAQSDETVAAEVLSVVDNTAGTGGATIDRIVDRIGTGRATLVLDNCEHVLAGVHPLVEALLDRLARLSIIATSRQVLGGLDERVVRLSGLRGGEADSPAVRLFVQRGVEQGVLDDSTDSRLAAIEIVDRLEGLPLALELAASRLASTSPHELLDALDDQLRLLSGGPGSHRHSTMERTIAWSYDLLSAAERRVLSELSVFRAPFRVDAAARVVEIEALANHLQHLVQCSMLARIATPNGTRFRLLEPIRQFVARQIDGDAEPGLGERHAEYFSERVGSLAQALHTSDEPIAAAELTTEWPDVVAAVRWGLEAERPDLAVRPLVALGFHIRWQQRTEAYGWLEDALDRLDLCPDLRRDALVVVALGAWTDGDRDRLAALHAQARIIGPTGVRGALLDLFSDFYSEDATRVVHRADELLQAAEEDGDPAWIEIASAFRLTARAMACPEGDETAHVAAELDRLSERSLWPSGQSWRLLAQLTWAVRRGQTGTAERIAAMIAADSEANGTPFFVQTAGPLLAGLGQAGIAQQLDRAAKSVKLTAHAEEQVNYSLAFRSAVIALHAAGHLATAARVAGFVQSLEGGGHFLQVMTAEYDDVVEALSRSLGSDEFAHLSQLGRGLDARSAAELVVVCSSMAEGSDPGREPQQ